MGDLVDLKWEALKRQPGWRIGRVVCSACGAEHIGILPPGAKEGETLECSRCGRYLACVMEWLDEEGRAP